MQPFIHYGISKTMLGILALLGTSLLPSNALAKEEIPVAEQVVEPMEIGEGSQVIIVYTVPMGKRLVIEYVSAAGATSPNHQEMVADIAVAPNGPVSQIQHSFGVLPSASTVFGYVNKLSQTVRLSADEGTNVSCVIIRSDISVEQNVACSIAGTLIDK